VISGYVRPQQTLAYFEVALCRIAATKCETLAEILPQTAKPKASATKSV
jgi:hypothetical protein